MSDNTPNFDMNRFAPDDGKLDTDLAGMEPLAAKEYVISFMATAKELQNRIRVVTEERDLWQNRVKLAADKGDAALTAAAQTELDQRAEKLSSLGSEQAELKVKVEVLMENLKRLLTQFQPTVDVDLLLAQLEMIAGKADPTVQKFKDHEAEMELEELKKKMKG